MVKSIKLQKTKINVSTTYSDNGDIEGLDVYTFADGKRNYFGSFFWGFDPENTELGERYFGQFMGRDMHGKTTWEVEKKIEAHINKFLEIF